MTKLGPAAAALQADVERGARGDRRARRLARRAPASKTGPSGVGIENYDWYLKHVQLVPYTWSEDVALMERELARARALLAMEEMRNASLPQPAPVASAEEYDRRFQAAVTEYMAFLRDREILTVERGHGSGAARSARHLPRRVRASSSRRWTIATPR